MIHDDDDIYVIHDIYDMYDSVCLFSVSFCWSLPFGGVFPYND